MLKILFLIHDLGQGGAEKVLVNLVNNMDNTKFDISVIALFGGGVNEQFLASHIHYKSIFQKEIPGNSKFMKILSSKQLHKLFVKDKYDIEISYLEGPSARVVSGCDDPSTKLVSWIHVGMNSMEILAKPFRSKMEAQKCYTRFDQTICVSQDVCNDFCSIIQLKKPCKVLYNTVESQKIISLSNEKVSRFDKNKECRLIAVGTLKETKGYDRLIRIIDRLKRENYSLHLYILGIGPLQQSLEQIVKENNLQHEITFLGYQTNPYKYIKNSDLFICASRAEGFSTAATEALILNVPVCTVEVSGMKEMLGDDNQYGIVTNNDEDSLYLGIKNLLDDPELLLYYKKQSGIRGTQFSTENTVKEVEKMLMDLMEK